MIREVRFAATHYPLQWCTFCVTEVNHGVSAAAESMLGKDDRVICKVCASRISAAAKVLEAG